MFLGIKQRPNAFLVLMIGESDDCQKLKATVCSTKLRPFGQFMMGKAVLRGRKIVLSGAYGSDGLPITVADQIYRACGTFVPDDLVEMWNKGDGWNSAGREEAAMRKWAVDNYKKLKLRNQVRHVPTGLPNLEGMTDDDLRQLRRDLIHKNRTTHEEMFGSEAVEFSVCSLINHLLMAREHRKDGFIAAALSFEAAFERELEKVPEKFRY